MGFGTLGCVLNEYIPLVKCILVENSSILDGFEQGMQFSFTPTYASILPLLFLAPDRLLTRFFVLVWYVHTLLFLPMAPSLRLITCALSSLSTSCYSCGRRNSL